MQVYEDMQGDWLKNFRFVCDNCYTCVLIPPHSYVIPPMLEAGVQALVYTGDQDFICNYVGNKYEHVPARHTHTCLQALGGQPDVGGQARPQPPPAAVGGRRGGGRHGDRLWSHAVFEGVQGGTWCCQVSRWCTIAQGHMVPMDQPKHSLASIQAFVTGQPLSPSVAQVA